MQYRGANIRLLKQPALSDVRATLTRLQGHGADTVAFNTFHYARLDGATLTKPSLQWQPHWLIFPDIGQDPEHPFNDTTDAERVYAYAELALDLGFARVILKPMIDPHYRGGWRGNIHVPPTLRRAFLRDYKERLLAPLLPIVKELDLDLCIGTEMVQVTKDYGADFWINIVKWLRWKGVRQRLTYAANWGWEADAEYNRLRPLWPHLDYIGIDAYWPMCEPDYTGPITKELLLDDERRLGGIGWYREPPWGGNWCPSPHDDLLALKRDMNKSLWFTEIGYGATRQAAHDPMGDTVPGERTTEVQRPLVEAAREKWQDHAEGMVWWEAGLNDTKGSTHDLLNTELGDVAWGIDNPQG